MLELEFNGTSLNSYFGRGGVEMRDVTALLVTPRLNVLAWEVGITDFEFE